MALQLSTPQAVREVVVEVDDSIGTRHWLLWQCEIEPVLLPLHDLYRRVLCDRCICSRSLRICAPAAAAAAATGTCTMNLNPTTAHLLSTAVPPETTAHAGLQDLKHPGRTLVLCQC